ncbi:hypothetical protein ABT282_34160 [Streptomyces sp. NPDC000927]|uniref:hypothetical protein n=1 Tax=Streptomyces sp. NPDC000927 TaxID=3154371 RepID=UPI003328F913
MPSTDAPKVVRQDDGSLTISDGCVRETLDARTAGMMERMYRAPVTEEARTGMAEALLRRASGYSLSDLMGPPPEVDAMAGRR